MILADIETPLTIIASVVATLAAAVAVLYRDAKKSAELRAVALEKSVETLTAIAVEATKSNTETANKYRVMAGKPPIQVVPDVISETHSPESTAADRTAAVVQTLRAELAAVARAEGKEPRHEPPHADEPGHGPIAKLKEAKAAGIETVVKIQDAITEAKEKPHAP